MAFEELKENLNEAEASARSYLENSREYYALKGFKFLMQGITAFSKVMLVTAVALFALLFLSVAGAFGLGHLLDSVFYGFLAVGLFYCILGILLYIFRHKVDKFILQKFSEFYFDEL